MGIAVERGRPDASIRGPSCMGIYDVRHQNRILALPYLAAAQARVGPAARGAVSRRDAAETFAYMIMLSANRLQGN